MNYEGCFIVVIFIIFSVPASSQVFDSQYDDSTRFQADEAYNLDKGEADYYVWYGCGTNKIDKPLIIVEGYDPFNDRWAEELYNEINQKFLARRLREEGYDIIGFNPKKGGTHIHCNDLAFAKLIEISYFRPSSIPWFENFRSVALKNIRPQPDIGYFSGAEKILAESKAAVIFGSFSFPILCQSLIGL
jgi:hypothetical protein